MRPRRAGRTVAGVRGLRAGTALADRVLERRRKALAAAAGRPRRGVLIAEGDSWFDYPFCDVLACPGGRGLRGRVGGPPGRQPRGHGPRPRAGRAPRPGVREGEGAGPYAAGDPALGRRQRHRGRRVRGAPQPRALGPARPQRHRRRRPHPGAAFDRDGEPGRRRHPALGAPLRRAGARGPPRVRLPGPGRTRLARRGVDPARPLARAGVPPQGALRGRARATGCARSRRTRASSAT